MLTFRSVRPTFSPPSRCLPLSVDLLSLFAFERCRRPSSRLYCPAIYWRDTSLYTCLLFPSDSLSSVIFGTVRPLKIISIHLRIQRNNQETPFCSRNERTRGSISNEFRSTLRDTCTLRHFLLSEKISLAFNVKCSDSLEIVFSNN